MDAAAGQKGDAMRLGPELGIEELAALREQLAARLHQEAPLTLDASAVSRVHGATLQLLCMFCVGRASAGRATRWQAPSAVLREAAALLALNPLLQLADNPDIARSSALRT